MPYIIIVILILILVYLLIRLRKKEQTLSETKEQVLHLKEQMLQAKEQADLASQAASDSLLIRDSLQEQAIIIHLYAALSKEESASATVKDKQNEILTASEEILHLLEKEPENTM